MSNTSATGGFLTLDPGPSRTETEDVIQDLIIGLTGLAGELVRPAFNGAEQPERDITWCSFQIGDKEPLGEQVVHLEDVSELRADRNLPVLVIFRGPNADDVAEKMSRGLVIPQNHDFLQRHSLALANAGTVVAFSELVHGNWIRRADLPLTLRQTIRTTVAIKDLKSVSMGGVINNADGRPVSGGFVIQR